MKTSIHPHLRLSFGLAFLLVAAMPVAMTEAADRITGTYQFEGKAKAKDTADGSSQTKKFKGKMRVGRKVIRFQIPVSVNGKVVACKKLIKAELNRGLKRSPGRASRRATFADKTCQGSNWFGIVRLKWIEHPEGYALAFTSSIINDEADPEKVIGRFAGSTGTLSTAENTPEPPDPPEPPAP